MLKGIVIDPSALPPTLGTIRAERQNIDALVLGLLSNAILVDTQQGSYFRRILAAAEKAILKGPDLQKTTIRIEELAKRKKRHIAKCPDPKIEVDNGMGDARLGAKLAACMKADAIVCGENMVQILEQAVNTPCEVIPISGYLDSNFEEERRALEESQDKPFDKMTDAERDTLISGGVRYAPSLVFYDRVIGVKDTTAALRGFRDGIGYVINIWKKDRVVLPNSEPVQIITKAPPGSRGIPGEGLEEHARKIYRELCLELNAEFGLSIRLVFKKDSDEVFHARHLLAKKQAFEFERGFDIYKRDLDKSGSRPQRQFMRSFVHRHPAGLVHLDGVDLLETLHEI